MTTLFAKATAGAALFPAERAVLRFLKTVWLLFAVAAFPVVSDLINALNTNSLSIDWQSFLKRLLVALIVSLLLAVQKYFTAQGDGTPLVASPVPSQDVPLVPSAPSYNPAPTEQPPLSESTPPSDLGSAPTVTVNTIASAV